MVLSSVEKGEEDGAQTPINPPTQTMTANSHPDEQQLDEQTTDELIDEERRSSFRPLAAGAFGLLTGLALANPASARVPHPTIQMKGVGNLAIVNKQSTRLGNQYVYVVRLKNKSRRRRRIKGYGKGPYNAYTPRTISGRSTGKFVFKTPRPLRRIVFTD